MITQVVVYQTILTLKIIIKFITTTTTLIISSDEIEDIIKIVKSLQDSGLLLKEVSETIQNEAKKQKGRFLIHFSLLGTLGASLLENIQQVKELLELEMVQGQKQRQREKAEE